MIASLLKKLHKGLEKTGQALSDKLHTLFLNKPSLDSGALNRLEEILIESDLGIIVTERLITALQDAITRKEIKDLPALTEKLKSNLVAILKKGGVLQGHSVSPVVTLFIGVNGVGKTTTVAKRGYQLRQDGKEVLLAAGDTFRAAAKEQLLIWGERIGAKVISHREGADPAALVYDAVSAAMARKVDHLLIDTAGRLHTKHNLMEELKKIERVIARLMPVAPHETCLVLDASTGQNALSQARLFHEAIGVTSLILTKLDGTAKGGMIVPIVDTFCVPVTYVGVGEMAEDLLPFEAESFVDALFASHRSH